LAHEAVCDVYDDAAWDRGGFDPVSGFRQDFEARIGVLRDEGEAFKVGVGADA